MRRILLVVAVAALMAAMLVASAMPAFASLGERDFAGPALGKLLGGANQALQPVGGVQCCDKGGGQRALPIKP
jgi:hypothetical protein